MKKKNMIEKKKQHTIALQQGKACGAATGKRKQKKEK
jgi:hypothetical protein